MTQHSQVYNEFYELHHDSFESIVFFYERNQYAIQRLPLEEQLELLAEYLNACFETAAYYKYLARVDELIESLIQYNIVYIHGRDEYNNSLFRKSAALFNLERYEESTHIVKQLCKMNPRNENARILYRRNLYQTLPDTGRVIRHMSGVGLLIAALLTGVDLFLWRYVSEDLQLMINLVRNIVFATSIISLLLIEFNIRWKVERCCGSF